MEAERQVRLVEFGSEEYRQTVRLRDAVLRAPLGLTFTPEQLDGETEDLHVACFLGDELVACLVLTPKDDGAIKMRQVAVRPTLQGQGIGKALVRASEQIARERGYREMVLHARETAVSFYLHLEYEVVGEPFEEVTVPHRAMRKALG